MGAKYIRFCFIKVSTCFPFNGLSVRVVLRRTVVSGLTDVWKNLRQSLHWSCMTWRLSKCQSLRTVVGSSDWIFLFWEKTLQNWSSESTLKYSKHQSLILPKVLHRFNLSFTICFRPFVVGNGTSLYTQTAPTYNYN